MDLTTVIDCTGANLAAVNPPAGVLMAGYITGSGAVPWTGAQFTAHPGAIRIDQSPVNTALDETADLLDVENGAATLADLPQWVHDAWYSFNTRKRPGQREPAIYSFQSNLTPIANTLVTAGITSGVNLFLSKPMPRTEAEQLVTTASGPFPIVGVQYAFEPLLDVSLVSTAWLSNVSKKQLPPMPTGTREIQVEYYRNGFGWVLCNAVTVPAANRYRARIEYGPTAQWQEITP